MTKRGPFRLTVTRALAATIARPSGKAAAEAVPVSAPSRGSESVLPEIGDTVGGLYRVTRLLGEGNFGKVFAAERVDVPEHKVALKVVPVEVYSGRDVARELVMLAAAGHPNVVQLKDHGMSRDYVWLTMPVYAGRTLEARLEEGPLSLREAFEIFVPVARGLSALHEAGLRHQDVKPDNIFLAEFGGQAHPVLLDLGVAAEKASTFCAGTILYASPEQILALGCPEPPLPLTEKMDVYCLGATLLRSLVGPELFPGERAQSRAEIAEAHERRATRPLASSALPDAGEAARAAIEGVLARMLAPHPAERPSMDEVARALDVLLEPEREAARAETRRRDRQTSSLRRLRAAAGMMLLVALGASAFAYAKRETLRLASELDRARAEGARSFDRLDTCTAAHDLAVRKGKACATARARDLEGFEKAEEERAEKHRASAAESARALASLEARLGGKISTCEGDLRLEREARAEESALFAERDAARKEREAGLVRDLAASVSLASERARTLESSQADLERCREALASRPAPEPPGEPRAGHAPSADDAPPASPPEATPAPRRSGGSGGSAGSETGAGGSPAEPEPPAAPPTPPPLAPGVPPDPAST